MTFGGIYPQAQFTICSQSDSVSFCMINMAQLPKLFPGLSHQFCRSSRLNSEDRKACKMPNVHPRKRKTGKRATFEDVIAFVTQVSQDLNRAPSLKEIAVHLGVSKTEADRKVRQLIRQGVLERGAAPLTRANGIPGIRVRATAHPAHALHRSASRQGGGGPLRRAALFFRRHL